MEGAIYSKVFALVLQNIFHQPQFRHAYEGCLLVLFLDGLAEDLILHQCIEPGPLIFAVVACKGGDRSIQPHLINIKVPTKPS